MRLDKFIVTCSTLSRSEAKKKIKKGITVNGVIIKSADYKIDENNDIVLLDEQQLIYKKNIYIMLNKPQNVVSATEDKIDKTVIDLLKDEDKILKPFPVGRLDKNTEGLILLTNNGELAHKLLSPKKDVEKKYYVEVDGMLTDDIVTTFYEGITIDGDYKCKSAKLELLSVSSEKSSAYIIISEGKFHQIKRMMKAVNLTVTYLKRLSIGSLVLDENLSLGEYRYLTIDEINKLQKGDK